MAVLDFGPIFTENGTILQISYAQKAAENGNTVIGIKSKNGVVVVVEKPIESKLYVQENNKAIKKINDDIFMTSSGIETDLTFLSRVVKDEVISYSSIFDEMVCPEKVCDLLLYYSHQFTRYGGARVLGINTLTGMRYKDGFKLITTDCSGFSRFYKANAIGKGACLAKTELEKLSTDDMSLDEMVKNAIRIMYKIFDPLKDKAFDVEVGIIDNDNKFKNLNKEEYSHYVEMFKDSNID